MDKHRTKLKRLSDRDNDDYVDLPMAERVGLVWPLTREAVSLSKRYDAEQILQRHITRLTRRKS